MSQKAQLITREQLAERWNCSTRTIDRMRTYGHIPWVDISGGMGSRPTVRFQLSRVQEFEEKNLKAHLSLSTSKLCQCVAVITHPFQGY